METSWNDSSDILPRFERGSIVLLVLFAVTAACSGSGGTEIVTRESPAWPTFQLSNVPSPSGSYNHPVWIRDQIIVQYEQELGSAYTARIWQLSPDGVTFEMLELPKHPSCGPDGVNGFGDVTRLPDGRLSYVVNCAPPDDLLYDKMYVMALDTETGKVDQLLDYPLPTFGVGTGGIQWNRRMDKALMGNARRYIEEQMYLFSDEGFDLLDVGLRQAYGPSWSPNGNEIAFIGSKEQGAPLKFSDLGLYLMDPAGENVRLLSDGLRITPGVSWSPDGKWLVFPAVFKAGEGEVQGLWLADPATGERTLIAEGSFGIPDWSPDSERIVVVEFVGPPADSDDRIRIITLQDAVSD